MFQTIANQFNAGGSFMWIILAVFGIAAAVMVDRCIYYFIINRGNGSILSLKISRALREGRMEDARNAIGSRNTPLCRMLRVAVERFTVGKSANEIEEGVQEAAIKEIPKLSQRLNYLALFANVSTLLGLLGTIAGLQVSFSSLSSVDAAQKASMLAGGISQAMNTTAFGLVVAVPCMVMYTILNNKQQSLAKDIDEAVVRVVNNMKAVTA